MHNLSIKLYHIYVCYTNVTLYHVIYSVRYYPQFHVTVVGPGTYYPRILGTACINANNILLNGQFGFWPKSTPEKASFKVINEILSALNNKLLVGGIFCNLDCVSRDILLSKLKFYAVMGKAFVLLKSYLEDRQIDTKGWFWTINMPIIILSLTGEK